MSRKGFSFDDLLHPKPRKYQPDILSTNTYRKTIGDGKLRAREIMAALKVTEIPIELEGVCSYLGAIVQEVSFFPESQKIAGRYLGDGKIQIKIGLPVTVYRSTLAHELGHLALNHDTRNKWHEVESYRDTDPHEIEAWDFAGEILVPDKILRIEYKKHPFPNDLATLFNVSRKFMWYIIIKRKYKLR